MVNKAEAVKIAGSAGPGIARLLRAFEGFDLDVVFEPHEYADAVFTVGDQSTTVTIQVKSRVNAAIAHQVAEYARASTWPVLLVADRTTNSAREILRSQNVGVVETDYASVDLPGLVLRVDRTDPSRKSESKGQTPLRGKAGIVAQALLLERERDWQVADLAEFTGASAAFAHRVLTRLEREGLVTTVGSGPRKWRKIAEPAGLLDLWAEEMKDRATGKIKLYKLVRSNSELAPSVLRSLRDVGLKYALTGAAAANLIEPSLTAIVNVDIWLSETADTDALARLIDASVVESGHNITILQSPGDEAMVFAQERYLVKVVNTARLYFDLLQDPMRGAEQAERIRRYLLADAEGTDSQ